MTFSIGFKPFVSCKKKLVANDTAEKMMKIIMKDILALLNAFMTIGMNRLGTMATKDA